MRYWVIIALACLANASDLPKDEEVTSSSSSVEELDSRFGLFSIGDSIIKGLKKLFRPLHNHRQSKHDDLSGSKNKGILDMLKFNDKRGRDTKRDHNEDKQGDILKMLLDLNKGNIIQKGQRGDDFGINLDNILSKMDSQSLKQGINFQQGSQTSNAGDSLESILREIFGGGNSAGNSGGKGIGNGGSRGGNNSGGRGFVNGGSRDTSNGGGRALGNGGSRDISNGGGRGLGYGGTRDTNNGGVGGISNGGGKGIRDGGLFGDGGFGGGNGIRDGGLFGDGGFGGGIDIRDGGLFGDGGWNGIRDGGLFGDGGFGGWNGIRDGGLFGDGGFGGGKGGNGRSKSGKNFNNGEDIFIFSS